MEPQRRLGNYALEERLGSGATADVFKALQSGIDRSVAIKVMHAHLAGSHDFAARFQREARAMGQLRHAHIARVVDFDATGDHPYMVIEFLPGGSLYEVMEDFRGQLSTDYCVAVARQLADALTYAHRLGMVHRDIKPANVMFADLEHQHAVLTDFGMARLTDDSMTMTGTMLGTPAYMAPEQVRGEGADAAADQYSLGVMLFEMVTGQRPFHADSPHALMIAHTSEAIPSVRALNPQVSPELEAVIHRTMAKYPADRFATTADLKQALDELAGAPTQSSQYPIGSQYPLGSQHPIASSGGPPSTPPPSSDYGSGARPLTGGGASDTIAVAGAPTGSKNAAARPSTGILVGIVVGVLAIAGVTVFALTQGNDGTQVPDVAAALGDDGAAGADLAPASAGADDAATDGAVDTPELSGATALDPENLPPLFVSGANIVDDRLVVVFDRVRQPAAGTTYVAWLDNVAGPLGEITPDAEGVARLDIAAPATAARAFTVTEEPIGAVPAGPAGTVVLDGRIDDAHADDYDQMLGALQDAARELSLAIDHEALLRDAVSSGNLVEVRRHAEHVVNILEGVEGDNFGDHDGSGLAENPGDDAGVGGHLTRAVALVGERPASFDTALVGALDQARAEMAPIVPAFLAVQAVDNVAQVDTTIGRAELVTMAASLLRSRAALLRDVAVSLTSPGLLSVNDAGYLSVLPGGTEVLVSARMAGGEGAAVGISGGADGGTPSQTDEVATLRNPIGGSGFRGLVPTQVVVGAEGQTTADLRVVASADISVGAIEAVERLINGDASMLQVLDAQAQLAADHAQLLQDQIDAGNHSEVRRHAEHIVNILEGADGEHYGDLDGSGVAENPGDDVGVLVYLNDASDAVEALPEDTVEQMYFKLTWVRAVDRIRANVHAAIDPALRVLATDSPAEAQPFATELAAKLALVLDGDDADGNGMVDLFAAELGTRGLPRQAPTLLTAPLLLITS